MCYRSMLLHECWGDGRISKHATSTQLAMCSCCVPQHGPARSVGNWAGLLDDVECCIFLIRALVRHLRLWSWSGRVLWLRHPNIIVCGSNSRRFHVCVSGSAFQSALLCSAVCGPRVASASWWKVARVVSRFLSVHLILALRRSVLGRKWGLLTCGRSCSHH